MKDYGVDLLNTTIVVDKKQHAKAEETARKYLSEFYSDVSGLPKWSLPYVMGFTGGTANIIGEGFEFLEGAYENIVGMSREEQIADGKNPLSVNLEKYYDFSNAFDTKYYDDSGNVLDFDDLFRKGEYKKAAVIASEGAAESAPSIIMSIANPLVGGAIMGISTAGGQYKDDLVNRTDQSLSAVISNALWAGGSEMLTEWAGGMAFRGINSMFKSGAVLSAVNDFTADYTLRLIGKTLGSGVMESVTEGVNSLIQDAGDMNIYGDEKSTKELIKNVINSVGPAFILGGLGGGAGSIRPRDNQELYKFIAPTKWKSQYLSIGKNINEANKDLQAAPESKKQFFKDRINDLVKKRTEHENSLFDVFENLSKTELKEYAENIDKANKNMDIIGNNNYSQSSQKVAEQQNLKYIQDNLNILGVEYTGKDVQTEKILGEALKASEIIEERLNKLKGINKDDLDIKILKTQEEVDAAVKEAGSDVKNSDGAFIGKKDGKAIIYINQNVASIADATNVVGHELLHYMISRKFKTDNKSMQPLIGELKTYLQQNNPEVYERVQSRIDKYYTDNKGKIKDGALEEYLNVFSDLIDKQKIDLKDSNSKGIMGSVKDVMAGFGFGSIKLDSAQDVVSFLKTYNKNINRKGLLGKLMGTKILDVDLTSTKLTKGKDKKTVKKGSRSTVNLDKGDGELSEKIDRLTKGAKTIEEFQKPGGEFDNVYTGILDGKFDRVFGEGITQAQKEIQRQNLADRLINFNPAKTPELSKWLYGGSGKAGNVVYAGLVAKKKLFEAGEKRKIETSINTEEAKQLEDTSTPTTEIEDKTKPRKLKDFDIELQDGLVDAEIIAEVEALLEKNPDDIQAQMEELILKDIRKKLDNVVGKIAKNKDTGKREPTPEYESFIRNEYPEVVSSLGIETIRKAYGPWFEKKKVRTEKYKGTSPTTGKVTNYVKDVFENTTNKREYIRWFLENKPGILTERRTALIRRIARRKTKIAIDNYIEVNSKDLGKVAEAKLRKVSRAIEDTQSEQKSFDSVRFSKTLKTATLFQEFSAIKRQTKKVKTKWIGYINPHTNLPQTFVDLGRMYEQAFANHFMRMKIKGLEVVSTIASEVGGMADFVMKYNGKIENHELKASITAFMGSISISSFKIKNGAIKLATDVHNNLLKDIDTAEFKKGYKKRIDFVNKGIEKLNKTRPKNKQYDLIDPNITSGKPQYIPYELYMDKKGFGNKVFYQLKSDEKVIQRHYAGKDVNSLSFVGTKFGNMSVRLNENSILNLPMLSADTDINFTFRNSGSKMINGDKMIALSLGVQFKISKLKNNPRTTPDITIKEQAQEALGINFSKSIEGNKLNKAIKTSRTIGDPKGITVLDFDDTLATTKSLVKFTTPEGKTGTLNAEEYASTYEDLLDKGYVFDFSDFNKVVKGKLAPLFNKAIKLQGKFGPENMFVLTARPPQAQKAIFDFLKANGLNIPLENITGLGNSTAEAKALWVADKVGEGFNDFYFADDALQNVQAVKNMLDQFDVKSKVQQAKVKFSESMDNKFNDIIEDITGIESVKRFDFIKARKRGASKGKFRFFIPPSHEDFVGLLYNFMGKGRKGDAHRDFLEQALIRPLNRANKEYDTARQSVATDYKNLNKKYPNAKKGLLRKTPDGDFTYQDAIRIYLWDKHGYNIPGLSPINQKNLVELVKSNERLLAYAEAVNVISKQEKYVDPTDGWDSGDIRMDLDDATGRIGRSQFFEEFNENTDIIFSKENLNKIEAGYGKNVREALEDILYRIKTGRNKPTGQNGMVNSLMNWVNGSVGSVMFFNMRSALLQQMSLVNYINFADNNIFAAAKAFANQKQYWNDWSFIFNSDMLKQRRGGIMTDVNGAELAAEMRKSKSPHRFLISKLLELGFLPTQIGDNIAIATGGATYYRNRINTYLKQGLSQKEAEAKAFTDFQDITQSTQQSARPDMVSQQQASLIGKIILNFQNVTSQFNRLGKKAFLDIKNRRITKPNSTQMQSDISNAARITYYFAVQNAIFYTLQTALFAMMFDDDEEDVNNLFLKKQERLINGSIDSVLRGTGIGGAIISTLKNVAIAFARQRDVNYNPDESAVIVEAFNFSPVLGIKARKIVNAEKTLNYNKKVIKEMETFDIDNPQWSAVTNYVEGFTNLPLNRLYNKTQNIRQGFSNEHASWERVLLFLGWSQYNLNLENKKMDKIKESTKIKKSKKNKTKSVSDPGKPLI
jgi:hypothetical protein